MKMQDTPQPQKHTEQLISQSVLQQIKAFLYSF